MLKKRLVLVSIFLLLFSLFGCSFLNKEKEFSSNGFTITLNESFVESELVNVKLFVQNTKMAMAMTTDSNSPSYYTTTSYLKQLMSITNTTGTIIEGSEGDLKYSYVEYTKEVDGDKYSYITFVFKSSSKYYGVDFWCREKNIESIRDQIFEYVKTVKVE